MNRLRKDNSFMRNLVHKLLIRGEKCSRHQTMLGLGSNRETVLIIPSSSHDNRIMKTV